MSQDISISQGAAEDISKLATGMSRTHVALTALTEQFLFPDQIVALRELLIEQEAGYLSYSNSSLQVNPRELIAKRMKSRHQAMDLLVTLDEKIPTNQLLEKFLGKEETEAFIAGWGERCQRIFNAEAPTLNHAVLVLDSNRYYADIAHAPSADSTTQEEFLEDVGFDFANDIQASIICAMLVNIARDVGLDLSKGADSQARIYEPETLWKQEQPEIVDSMDENKISILSKLRRDGISSKHGVLIINEKGQLSVDTSFDRGLKRPYAFGGIHPKYLVGQIVREHQDTEIST